MSETHHPHDILLYTDDPTLASGVRRSGADLAGIIVVDSPAVLFAEMDARPDALVLVDPRSGRDTVDLTPSWWEGPKAGPPGAGGPARTGLGVLVDLHRQGVTDRCRAFFPFGRFRPQEHPYAAACAWLLGPERVVHSVPSSALLDRSTLFLDEGGGGAGTEGVFVEDTRLLAEHTALLFQAMEKSLAAPWGSFALWLRCPWASSSSRAELDRGRRLEKSHSLRSWIEKIERSRGNLRSLAVLLGVDMVAMAIRHKELSRHIGLLEMFAGNPVPDNGRELYHFVQERIEFFREDACTEAWEIVRGGLGRAPVNQGKDGPVPALGR
ncbi:hypothetical protein [Nocardiopsis lambiniae]|uniref:Uncharacterized protein n=1 Tax=Nocardiopsis lambiniae TaxID=3075539 RepID=A0ABU2M9C4_9ACTN|nr:hypothetical protein [Nocardiopsis sp. DSM 44743]MDT0329273.1 hypothetical protein [Nocardiopsis sp. DSM 44743]